MKKLTLILVLVSLLATSSLSTFAQTPDRGNSPPTTKSSTTQSTTLPKFENTSKTLNWTQKGPYTVYTGKTYKLPATSTATGAITYSSSDAKILTISKEGMITPLKTGEVVIFAKQGTITIGMKLTIKVNPNGATATVGNGVAVGGSSGRGTTTGVKTGNDHTFDFGNGGNNTNTTPAPKLTQSDIDWIIKEGRAYGESLGMTWSTERHGESYPLDGYNTTLSTRSQTKEQVLETVKHTYLDVYNSQYNATLFAIELVPNADDAYWITVYHG